MATAKTWVFKEKKRYKCDHLCIRFMEKECCTEREDGMCDQPDMYREIGDVIDALNDEEEGDG